MMKAYPQYKESGVEWLGDIPTDWTVKKLKYLCSLQTGDKDTVNAKPDADYDFFVRAQKIEKIDTYSHDCEAVLTAGDGVGVGKVFHYTNDKFSFHQRVYMMNDFKDILGRYFYYYLRTLFARVALDGGAKSTVDSLRMPTFTNFHFSYPSLEHQELIVRYLDVNTARIDNLIAEKENFVKLLSEKRQALISHVVTKGLNPNVDMKDSGVEWIGEIPEHWKSVPLKHLVNTRKGVAFKSDDFTDAGIPLVKASDIKNKTILKPKVFLPEGFDKEYPSAILRKHELILSTVGSTPDVKNSAVGQLGLVPESIDGALLNQNTVVYTAIKSKILPLYLQYLVQLPVYREHLDLNAHGTANQASLNITDMLDFSFSIPDLEEQQVGIDYLAKKLCKLDELEVETNGSIELLKEHRTALISAAVTGKIDVREEV